MPAPAHASPDPTALDGAAIVARSEYSASDADGGLNVGNARLSDPKSARKATYTLDPNRRAVVLNNRVIDLSSQEYTLADVLIRARGAVVSYASLVVALWPDRRVMDPRRHLAVVAHNLRAKGIEARTRRGVGMVLS